MLLAQYVCVCVWHLESLCSCMNILKGQKVKEDCKEESHGQTRFPHGQSQQEQVPTELQADKSFPVSND